MGFAFFYFTTKIFLFCRGNIRLNIPLNLLFLAFLYLFSYLSGRFKNRALKYAGFALSFVFGLLLLWQDTWFPSPAQTYSLFRQYGLPSNDFILDFISRFYAPVELGAAAAFLAAAFFVRKYTRTVAVGLTLLLSASYFLPGSAGKADEAGLTAYLDNFYETEAKRIIHFKKPEKESSQFDIVLLSICSIAWDDLKMTGLENHPLFSKFDYVFDRFNSVSSYSNPAVIRLLNANTGQVKHSEMYNGLSKTSSIFESFKALGYENYYVLNHDGVYGRFLEQTRQLGNMDGKIVIPSKLPYKVQMFDNSPVYDNYATLKVAWEARQKSRAPRAAIFYNTASLHDGCHPAQDWEKFKSDPEGAYKAFLKDLLDDTVKYLELVEASGRNAVVVFIPEHGRALRGSPIQVSGLRDVPLPDITSIPVGIKLIGKRSYPYAFRQAHIPAPSSFLALSYILSVFIEKNPFISQGFDSDGFIQSVPKTDFVSENEENTVVEKDGTYFLFGKEKKWVPVPAAQKD